MTLPRVKPLGWSLYDPATSAQLTLLDINASKGVDGTFINDYAAALWFPTQISTGSWSHHTSHIFIPKANCWLGVSGGGSAGSQRLYGAGAVTTSATYPTGQDATLLTSGNIAYDGGDVVVQGSSVVTGTTCFRRTTVSGDFDVWTTQSASAVQLSGGGSPNVGLVWHPASSLFIASYSVFSATAIDTSPDGITFTSRSTPDTHQRGSLATNGITVVCLPGHGVTLGTCLSSPDGITWTSRTLPFTTTWIDVTWSSKLGLFVAVTADARIATSQDGVTWAGLTPVFAAALTATVPTFIGIRDLAGMLIATFQGTTANSTVRKGVMCSVDAGASWRPLLVTTSDAVGLAVSAGQCVWADSSFAYFSNCLAI